MEAIYQILYKKNVKQLSNNLVSWYFYISVDQLNFLPQLNKIILDSLSPFQYFQSKLVAKVLLFSVKN